MSAPEPRMRWWGWGVDADAMHLPANAQAMIEGGLGAEGASAPRIELDAIRLPASRLDSALRERIAAVVHVDGTARPQVIERDVNPLYYDILKEFERVSGLPVLVNTSFNVHEEPIVNAPAECARALTDGRIDFVVTAQGLYERIPAPAAPLPQHRSGTLVPQGADRRVPDVQR